MSTFENSMRSTNRKSIGTLPESADMRYNLLLKANQLE